MGSEAEIERGGRLPFLCECGAIGCDRCAPMTREEYELLPRSDQVLALAPGHELRLPSGPGQRDG
jgi:hypothetical protein